MKRSFRKFFKKGYSPVQVTASGAGSHGKIGKRKNRHERHKVKRKLRQGDFDA